MSTILKFLLCLVNKNSKVEEYQWWLQEKLFHHLLHMIQIQELQVLSVTDSLLVLDIKNSSSIVWLVEKGLLILQSKHLEAVISKDVLWNILKAWKLNTIILLEIAMEVLFNSCMDKTLSTLQNKSSLIRCNSWQRMWLC